MTPLRASSPLAALVLLGTIAAQSGGPTMALAQGFSVDPLTTLPLFSSASVVLTKTIIESFSKFYVTEHPAGLVKAMHLPE